MFTIRYNAPSTIPTQAFQLLPSSLRETPPNTIASNCIKPKSKNTETMPNHKLAVPLQCCCFILIRRNKIPIRRRSCDHPCPFPDIIILTRAPYRQTLLRWSLLRNPSVSNTPPSLFSATEELPFSRPLSHPIGTQNTKSSLATAFCILCSWLNVFRTKLIVSEEGFEPSRLASPV